MRTADVLPHLDYVLEGTDFEHLGPKTGGKVRDVYTQGDRNQILIVSSDRFTGFDRQLAVVPFKGEVNTRVAQFWFDRTRDIIPNHMLAVPDPNVLVARRMKVLPIEMVVRGFMTGVTSTALWTNYQRGQRTFNGVELPPGMIKNQRLESPVITPTTKYELHDRNLTVDEILETGMVSRELWERMGAAAIALFERGQAIAEEKELVLVDTKYEFGVDEAGVLHLVDEVHTSDSSRYWLLGNYLDCLGTEREPAYHDKEHGRLWFVESENVDPYKDPVLPAAPEQLVAELACRYVTVYEHLTGNTFGFDPTQPIAPRIETNLRPYQVW